MEIGKAHAIGGEGIKVGGGDFAAKGADIGKALIVGEQDDDVGGWGRAPLRW